MKHRNAKLTACVLTGAMIFSVSSMITDATSVSSFLPAAGLALVMEEGSTLEEVKAAASAMDAVVSRAAVQYLIKWMFPVSMQKMIWSRKQRAKPTVFRK